MESVIIRPIKKEDNAQIATIVRSILEDFDMPKAGSAYSDVALDDMYTEYQKERSAYFVVEMEGSIVGGAGIAQLENYDGPVCELQKMYYLPEARGRGIGTTMMEKCLALAKQFGYKQCYLETMPHMIAAQKLYERSGFRYLNGPLGDTGHYACQTHMLKDL